MKVRLALDALPASGGMYRVYAGLRKHLPNLGVEFVDTVDDADVVHAHIQIYEKYAPSVPLVVTSHGMLWNNIWDAQWSTNKQLIQAYLQADIVTAPSQFVADAITNNTLMPTRVINHGIDIDEWLPADHEGYVLWNKARIDPANDPADMQQLARLAPYVMFKSTYGTPASNVSILGLLTPEHMREVVRHTAVYLDTALESGGPCFGVLEAMSCGVPVLAWKRGGNAEAVVHKETGYLAQPGNFDDLMAGLDYCLSNRDRLGENARHYAIGNYQWKDIAEEYVKAYQYAIDAHKHSTKVSVIVPCYNLGKYLPACLDSVLAQTFTDWEAVVVDDASTDNSLEIAQSYASKDRRIRVYHNDQNLHVSDTRNRAIELARGEYILPLDADDRIAKEALEDMVDVLDADRATQIVSGKLLVCSEYDLTEGYYGGWPNNTDFNLQITGYNRLPYSSMYRKAVWERLGGYRRRIRTGIEDADFWTRALSYGCKAEIIEPFTLYYTQRDGSLRMANPHGAIAWMRWFPWTYNPDVIPFGATGDGPYTVLPYEPEVSVIIPVGPGHAHHIQGCIDSLIAQSYQQWTAIVVNDTGERWFDDDGKPLTQYVMGMPFVRFIDDITRKGAAEARNMGVTEATTERIVFLDVDDTAQPLMLDVLIKAQNVVDGWIYGDWFVNDGSQVSLSYAPDWDTGLIMQRAIAPLTGIYWRHHIELVGGFSDDAPGWEDWDFHLKLVEQGICGTRMKYPLITYNMHLGSRREDNFSNKDDLLNYITKKHPELYKQGRLTPVACSRCGGGTSLRIENSAQANGSAPVENMVKIEYTGPEAQFRLIKSPTHPGAQYAISNLEPFFVYESDVEWILSIKDFRRAPVAAPAPPVKAVGQAVPDLPLVSEAPRTIAKTETWEDIELRQEVISILKTKFATPNEVRRAPDMELRTIKGIGDARLRTIRQALSNV